VAAMEAVAVALSAVGVVAVVVFGVLNLKAGQRSATAAEKAVELTKRGHGQAVDIAKAAAAQRVELAESGREQAATLATAAADRIAVEGVLTALLAMRELWNREALSQEMVDGLQVAIALHSEASLARLALQEQLDFRLTAVPPHFQERLPMALQMSRGVQMFWTNTNIVQAMIEAKAVLAELADPHTEG
jgi:hypothetical protein